MCGHDHNKQVIMMNIMDNQIPLIVCGTGGKVYDDINDIDCLDEKSSLEFFSNNWVWIYSCVSNTPRYYFFE